MEATDMSDTNASGSTYHCPAPDNADRLMSYDTKYGDSVGSNGRIKLDNNIERSIHELNEVKSPVGSLKRIRKELEDGFSDDNINTENGDDDKIPVDLKRQRFLEVNRIKARERRKRQKVMLEQQENVLSILMNENKLLVRENKDLRRMVAEHEAREKIRQHQQLSGMVPHQHLAGHDTSLTNALLTPYGTLSSLQEAVGGSTQVSRGVGGNTQMGLGIGGNAQASLGARGNPQASLGIRGNPQAVLNGNSQVGLSVNDMCNHRNMMGAVAQHDRNNPASLTSHLSSGNETISLPNPYLNTSNFDSPAALSLMNPVSTDSSIFLELARLKEQQRTQSK